MKPITIKSCQQRAADKKLTLIQAFFEIYQERLDQGAANERRSLHAALRNSGRNGCQCCSNTDAAITLSTRRSHP